MKPLVSKRRMMVAAGVIVLLLFVLRPGASRLKSRIVASISAGIGRSVEIGSVHFRLLPRPGFDLDNLVVYDDPAFGTEPMLRAAEVTADLRLPSLLRGRFEIARLDLSEPSLNVVHGDDGRWNLEALLERAAHDALAPTAKGNTGPRQQFPYIEATSARINLKTGAEKKPYALINADFSLWQDSENAWGVRLKAQPVRTDLNLNDTGTVQVNGTWQRAERFRDTPMDFTIEWSRGQIGQLTKFFTGSDQGWRGAVQLDLSMKGTPAALHISSDASVQDFRRYDITSGDALILAGHCQGQYTAVDHAFHQIDCKAPVGNGSLTLTGDMGLPGSRKYGLTLAAEGVPTSAAAILARRMKKGLPDDLVADGTARGSLTIRDGSATSELSLDGKGEIAGFRLQSVENGVELGPETIPFVVSDADAPGGRQAKRTARLGGTPVKHAQGSPYLEFGPFPLTIGHTPTPTVRASLTGAGYEVAITGDTEIGKFLRIANIFGIPALQSTAEGTAGLDLEIAGSWGYGPQSGFIGPQVTGIAKLRNVRVAFRGTATPVEVPSAEMQLLPSEVRVEKLTAKAGDALWAGSLVVPRGCGIPGDCELHFNLKTNRIGLSDLSAWLRPPAKERPWYRVLEPSATSGPPFFSKLRASGHITADNLQVENLVATHASADLVIDNGKVKLSGLTADLLGGKHRGEWQADFSVKPAICSGSAILMSISLDRVAELMNDDWITGTADGNYQIKGPCSAEFWESAEGTAQFEIRDAALSHIVLAEDEPLSGARMKGGARLQVGQIELKNVRLDSPSGNFRLSGTASLNGELDVKLMRLGSGAGGFAIVGTVAEPRVTAVPGPEQARLKP